MTPKSKGQQQAPTSFADPKLARRGMLLFALGVLLFGRSLPQIHRNFNLADSRLEAGSWDMLLRIHEAMAMAGWILRTPPKDAVVVGIDDASLDQFGRWPWPRDLQADLVLGLHRLGARAIALDVLFSEPEVGPVQATEAALSQLARSETAMVELKNALARVASLPMPAGDPLEEPEIRRRWLLRPDGPDLLLADAIRRSGRVVMGVALSKGLEGEVEVDWLAPAVGLPPPRMAKELLSARGVEMEAAELEDVWRSGKLLRLLVDQAGLRVSRVGGYGGYRMDELVGKMGPLQIERLKHLELPLYRGSVRGLGFSRGILMAAGKGLGYMNDETLVDTVVRTMTLVATHDRILVPSLSLATLELFLEGESEVWLAAEDQRPEEVRLVDQAGPKGRTLAVFDADRNTRIWVHYYPTAVFAPREGEEEAARDPLSDQDPMGKHLISVSAGDVLKARRGELGEVRKGLLEGLVKGRAAFVGVTALGLTDVRSTPLAEARPGVEMHATVFSNLLNGDYLVESDAAILWATALRTVVLLVLALVMPRVNPIRGGAAATTLVVGIWGACLYGVTRGMVMNPWGPTSQILLLFTVGIIYLNRFENRDKRWIEDMFKRYVSPAYVEELKANKGELVLGGKEVHITPFFSDLEKFSTISESFRAERLFRFLGEYLGEMTDILDRHGGTLDKYQGDAVVAFFGAPIHRPDHAVRACQAAIDMRQRLRELNEKWRNEGTYEELLELARRSEGWVPIRFRIGLNTGPCATGHLGTAERGNYTMMGDTVNLASRLEGVCKNYGIDLCISESTYAEVKDEVLCREIDLIRVVGKTVPTRIYSVAGFKDRLPPDQVTWVHRFQVAMERYKARSFPAALEAFETLAMEYAHDKVSRLYVDRCRKLVAEPPPADWDGVTEMTSK